jgi:crossover junction endodeoxyribonuclease RuvC
MKVIGIDVGLSCTGYAVMEDKKLISSGVYRTSNKLSLPERLKKLYDSTKSLIQKELPEVVVYETIFYRQNPKTLSLLAQARGALLLAAQESGVKIKEYTPREVKKAISGSGRASKYQIHGMVERLLGIKLHPSLHIGDAVACALCYLMKNGK